MDNFSFTRLNPELFPRNIRVACLAMPDYLENARFAEDMAVNRGFQIKMFIAGKEALDWLLSS